MRIVARIAAATVCLAIAMTVRAETAEMPDPASFSPGETWEWRQMDSRTGVEEGKRVRSVVNEDGVLKFSDGSATSPLSVAFVGGAPAKPFRVWPLAVGKKWQFEENWTRADGVTGNTKQDVEVVG